MKVLITGAHFTPAQAVIEELLTYQRSLPARQPKSLKNSGTGTNVQTDESVLDGKQKLSEIEIVYLGRQTTREGDSSPSIESQVLPKLGVRFIPIIAGRVRRYFSLGTIISLFKIPVGFIQTFLILLREQPAIVVSFGGYVAVPVVFNAWLLNIPILVHEQTLVSGLANTFSNIFASKIAVSFDKEYSFNKKKLLLTGNPMRKSIVTPNDAHATLEIKKIISEAKRTKKPILLVTGGNQGSHTINLMVEEVISSLTKKYFVVHQTGDSKFRDYERLFELRKTLGLEKKYLVSKWIDADDMGFLYRSISLAVSRAGANTLLELAFFGIPTLMIPLPFVTKDEQTKNAHFFEKKGLGIVLTENNLHTTTFLNSIEDLYSNSQFSTSAKEAKSVVILDAEKKLAQEILLLPYQV